MGRLIDADSFVKKFCVNSEGRRIPEVDCDNREITISIKDVKKYIREQPTAYDTEKVIAELESFAKLAEDRWANGTSNHAYQEHKCWVKAIEIVRKGGAE